MIEGEAHIGCERVAEGDHDAVHADEEAAELGGREFCCIDWCC